MAQNDRKTNQRPPQISALEHVSKRISPCQLLLLMNPALHLQKLLLQQLRPIPEALSSQSRQRHLRLFVSAHDQQPAGRLWEEHHQYAEGEGDCEEARERDLVAQLVAVFLGEVVGDGAEHGTYIDPYAEERDDGAAEMGWRDFCGVDVGEGDEEAVGDALGVAKSVLVIRHP